MLFQIIRNSADGHPVNAWTTLICLNLPQCFLQVVSLTYLSVSIAAESWLSVCRTASACGSPIFNPMLAATVDTTPQFPSFPEYSFPAAGMACSVRSPPATESIVAVLPTGKAVPLQVRREGSGAVRQGSNLAWSAMFSLPDGGRCRLEWKSEETAGGLRYSWSLCPPPRWPGKRRALR
jgi:hypothetical protein